MEYGSGPSLEPPYIMRISCLGREEIEFGFCVMPSAANLHSRLQHCRPGGYSTGSQNAWEKIVYSHFVDKLGFFIFKERNCHQIDKKKVLLIL